MAQGPLSNITPSLITFGKDNPCSELTVICVPHAGGSAAAFYDWAESFGRFNMSVQAIHWGQEEENGGYCSIEKRAAGLIECLHAVPGRLILLGHSLGALVAAEAARILDQLPESRVERIVVCASPPPGSSPQFPAGILTAPDEQVVAYLRRLGGTDESVLSDPEFRPQLLRSIRHDLDLIERYTPQFSAPLSVPLSVYGGAEDASVPVRSMDEWSIIGANVTIRVFSGGHFFIHSRSIDIAKSIHEDMKHHP